MLLSKRAIIFTLLFDNNIELYEWNKTVLYGKAAVVDGC
jgi:cardiolipin synthase